MIHGARDELVSPQHEDRLSKRLTEAGRPIFYLRLPWATHGCDANFSALVVSSPLMRSNASWPPFWYNNARDGA